MSTPAAAVLEGAPAAAPAAAPIAPTAAPTAPAANQSFFSSWDKPDQKDVREWVANKNYADPFTLAKAAREAETSMATLRAQANLKGYPTETKNADGTTKPVDAQTRAAWNATMGVPETADKYEVPLPSSNPYPQFADYLKAGMHEIGVPAAMAPQLGRIYEAAVTKLETEIRTQEDTQSKLKLAELQNAWGPNYQERVSLASRGKEWLSKEVGGLNDIQMRTLEAVLGTDKFMTAMWKFGAGNKEPGFAGSNGNPGTFGTTASSAQVELDQITADRSAGKISDHQWREKSARFDELVNIISSGMAPRQ